MIRGPVIRLLLALVVLLGAGAPAVAQSAAELAPPNARPEAVEVGPVIERSVAARNAADDAVEAGTESAAGDAARSGPGGPLERGRGRGDQECEARVHGGWRARGRRVRRP